MREDGMTFDTGYRLECKTSECAFKPIVVARSALGTFDKWRQRAYVAAIVAVFSAVIASVPAWPSGLRQIMPLWRGRALLVVGSGT